MINLGRVLSISLSLSLLALPMYAEPKEKKTKEEKMEAKEKKAEEKNASRYEKVKEFAVNKYKTDPEFRDQVDQQFDDTMRKHMEEAFQLNRRRESHLVRVHEDTWREHTGLYDNLMVQDHINRLGQRLVPPDSEKLYAFKVIPDPIPMARSLSTGTIYVSTGMIGMLDSEAQLAYVLAHEMAHVHLDHWRERSMIELGEHQYSEAQLKKAERIGMIGAVAGAAVGGAIAKSATGAITGMLAGGVGGFVIGEMLNRPIKHIEWDKVQEDQADDLAFKAVLNTRYDVREVPKLYASMEKVAAKDARVQLGFLGQRKRIKQRMEKAEDLIANAYKADIEAKQKNGFLSSSARHRNLMAELKRDNGILAFYHDMFEMARTNLAEAAAIRDNDPAVHYFYAKTLELVGRTDEDARIAKESFFKATKADVRKQNYGAHLHLALMLSRENGTDAKQVTGELDTYVNNYARWSYENRVMNGYPPNLDSIYEYVSMYGGDPNWRPTVPDFRELQNYRQVSDALPREPEPAAEAVVAPPPPPPAPSPEPAKAKRAINVLGAVPVLPVKKNK